jgi:hypothetical protein
VKGVTVVAADDYCAHLCGRAKACNASFDRQTCLRECKSESGVITNLNPQLLDGLYECVENTSCSTIAAERFVATCLADSGSSIEPSSTGKFFCQELETAADECSFTDYDQRACWQVTNAYADAVLESAAICAKKKCQLIVDCLDATMKVPSELDGSPIGFENAEFSSGNAALPASASLFPETASASVSPHTPSDTTAVPTTEPTPTTEEGPASSRPAATTERFAPPLTSAPPGLDVSDPDVRAAYCSNVDPCTDCSLGACCVETLACITMQSCVDWISCFTDCAVDDRACEDECRITYATGEDAAFEYIACFTSAPEGVCANACSAPDAGPTDGPETVEQISGATTERDPTHPDSNATSTAATRSSADNFTELTAVSDTTATTDGGLATCGECLDAACDSEVTACLDDDACYYVYANYAYCFDTTTTASEFAACFDPYYEYYLAYEPDSIALFDAMDDCINSAVCPACD